MLDNLEQLLPGAAVVIARLLAEAPGLHVLATSREPLRLQGEQVLALEPLPVPDPERTSPDVAALLEYASVRLFSSRVRAVRRDFQLDADSAAAVATICRRLEGLPLALELVAVRLRSQSPRALLPHLERELAMGRIRDLPGRQQTVRATIEWSVRTLDPEHQQLLWQLSVFPGTFTLDAAEAVCGAGSLAAPADVSAGVLELVDRSIVRLHAGVGVDRFDLLLPIREFAAERLAEVEPDDATLDRHATHFGAAIRFDPDGTRDDRSALATVVEEDWHNIRAALDRLHRRGDAPLEVAISPMLARCLGYLGREGAALAVLRHAALHLHPDDAGDDAISVRIHLANLEYESDRITSAIPMLVRAHELLGADRSPALIVYLAAVNAILHDPCGLGAAFFDDAHDLLERMGDRGNPLPKWYVAEYWLFAAIGAGLAGDARVERLQAEAMASSSGREHLRIRCGLGVNLCWTEHLAEAEQVLAVFEDDLVRGSAYPATRVIPLIALAEIRLATGRPDGAARSLDAAETDLARFDQPWEHGSGQLLRAAIDRASGRSSAATDRVRTLLASLATEERNATTGYAHWLLAVIERERGAARSATAELRSAWSVAGTDVEDDLKNMCLLERCVQRLEDAPVDALHDFALAVTHPAPGWMHLGVTYDVAALRRVLERRLGRREVEIVVQETAGRKLALPDWDLIG